jgi:hypothetical protein
MNNEQSYTYTIHQYFYVETQCRRKPHNGFFLYVFKNYIHWKHQLPLFSSCNWKEALTPYIFRLQPEGSSNSPILWLQPEGGYNSLCSLATTLCNPSPLSSSLCSQPSWPRKFLIQTPPPMDFLDEVVAFKALVGSLSPPPPMLQLLSVCKETGPDSRSFNPLHLREKKGSLLHLQSACWPVHGFMALTSADRSLD